MDAGTVYMVASCCQRSLWRGIVNRDEVIVAHLPMVQLYARRIASRLVGQSLVDEDDLASEGAVALLRAFETYDESRGVTFGAYARARVRGSMLDFLRKVDHLSKGKRLQYRELKETADSLEQEMGRRPTDDELSDVHPDIDPSLLGRTASVRLPYSVEAIPDDEPDETVEYVRMMVQWEHRKWAKCAIAWHWLDQWTITDLAKHLQVSERSVSEAISLGIQRMREEFGVADAQEPEGGHQSQP